MPGYRRQAASRTWPGKRHVNGSARLASVHPPSGKHAMSVEPSWVALPDDELLKLRIRDLHVKIESSELEPRIGQLFEELEQRGLRLKPECYLGDEWFSPEGSPLIAIPFYLAHPRL